MLVRSFFDIRWFMVMLVLCVTAFAFAILIIQNREERTYEQNFMENNVEENEALTDNMFDNSLLD